MPDWKVVTKKLEGKAPEQAKSPVFLRFLSGCGRFLISLAGTILVSLGLTVLVNPSLRQAIWEAIQKLW
ncbi:hypothetical protein MUB23_16325 [Cuneatibacter sp. NSJ-177]|uniref:hypothetical protein n=1 Tax=Cuneatibacter sp. NSJ-177 TaxID=2931401 RepID=UPI001FD1D7E6|nr:hypothetical protein [Cuneatibacter sp. NSJ-177]MCJ7836945.1 hypothetical protein [Cuneatibacter sp. NSJ-177]